MAEGKRVAYYKPFSATADNDPDVAFVSQSLLSGSDSPDVPTPYPLPQAADGLVAPNAQAIQETVGQLQGAADVALIEAPDLYSPAGTPWPLPLDLAALLDCQVLLMFHYSTGLDVATVVSDCEDYSQRLAGVVINGVTEYRKRAVDQGLVADLRARGLPVLGAVSEDRTMLAVTVQQIAEHLGGRWVQDPVNTGAHVDRFLIGGNIMDSGHTYYGRYANQVVITRAERPDIQMACLMEDTKCLVLTGGAEPIEYVKAEAFERDVPLILVDTSTLSTVDALGGVLDRATAHSLRKTERFDQLMRQNLDMAALNLALN
jgi:BioD-like phosphotransacetylase family protein